MRILLRALLFLNCAALGALLNACSTSAPGEKGPDGTRAFYLQVQASRDGISVETNNVLAGKAPLTIKVFGDTGGTFHNFGAPQFVVRALPATTNAFVPTQKFRTGTKSTPGDKIPGVVFFDMDRPSGSFTIDTFPEN